MKDKKTIFHITTSLGNGGAEGVLFRLCTTEKEFEHVVIDLRSGGKYKKLLEDNNIKVISLGFRKVSLNIKPIIKLVKAYYHLKPSITQGWMYHGDFVATLLSLLVGHKKTLWNIRTSFLVYRHSYLSTFFLIRVLSLLSNFIPKYIIGCSKQSLNFHKKIGYNKRRMYHIPNGINTDIFKFNKKNRLNVREELSITPDVFLFGMVARYDPQKDHDNLFKALSMLKENNFYFKCILVGSKIEYHNDELLLKIKNNNIDENLILVGERSDLNRVYSALDCHILSSSYGEAFPNVIAEAMACGVQCIATDVGDSKEIIGKSGWIVPKENSKLLFKAMSEAISQNKTNSKKRDELKKIIEDKYTLKKMVQSYSQLYKSILV